MRTYFTFEFHVNLVNGAFASFRAATQHVRRNEKYVWCNELLLLIIFVLLCFISIINMCLYLAHPEKILAASVSKLFLLTYLLC